MSEPLRYYGPMEVPAFSFIWEAVMWVTFGRFPEGNGYEDVDELKEDLGTLSFAWKDSFGGPRYRFKGFWWFESEMAGIGQDEVDWDRYESSLRSGYARIDVLHDHLQNAEQKSDEDVVLPHLVDRNELYRKLCRQALAEFPFVESVHRLYQQQIDRGWSKIFEALVDGKLKGYGWADLTQDEIRVRVAQGGLVDGHTAPDGGNVSNPWGYRIPEADLIGPLQPMAAHMEIPRKEWSLGGVAPDARYITAAGRDWWDVCFPNDQLFALFPRPMFESAEPSQDMIEVVNPGVAISRDNERRQPTDDTLTGRSGRGRKKRLDGDLERACQVLYAERWMANEKEDAVLADAQAFAMSVWGQSLPRSTFQGYMKPFRRAPEMLPETLPGIAAE
jgi:hypothetical protein